MNDKSKKLVINLESESPGLEERDLSNRDRITRKPISDGFTFVDNSHNQINEIFEVIAIKLDVHKTNILYLRELVMNYPLTYNIYILRFV